MISSLDALEILVRCDALGDFHALRSSVVDALLVEADRLKYRKPKNANGSRGRYFHAHLSRRADSLTAQADDLIAGRSATVVLSRKSPRGYTRSVKRSSW